MPSWVPESKPLVLPVPCLIGFTARARYLTSTLPQKSKTLLLTTANGHTVAAANAQAPAPAQEKSRLLSAHQGRRRRARRRCRHRASSSCARVPGPNIERRAVSSATRLSPTDMLKLRSSWGGRRRYQCTHRPPCLCFLHVSRASSRERRIRSPLRTGPALSFRFAVALGLFSWPLIAFVDLSSRHYPPRLEQTGQRPAATPAICWHTRFLQLVEAPAAPTTASLCPTTHYCCSLAAVLHSKTFDIHLSPHHTRAPRFLRPSS